MTATLVLRPSHDTELWLTLSRTDITAALYSQASRHQGHRPMLAFTTGVLAELRLQPRNDSEGTPPSLSIGRTDFDLPDSEFGRMQAWLRTQMQEPAA